MTRPLRCRLVSLRPALARAAQAVYDFWDQDENGVCEVRGTGGICDDIADAFGEALSARRIDFVITGSPQRNHTWVVVYDAAHAYDVDVHPDRYERGSGFRWCKIPGVKIRPQDVLIHPLDRAVAQRLIDENNLPTLLHRLRAEARST